jgi:hypothetical protein
MVDGRNMLVVRADRKEPLVVVPLLDALRDLKEEEAREGVESGLTDAKRRYDAADDAYDNLTERLLNTPAKTIEGVLEKARVMQHVYVDVDIGAALQERMRRMGPDDEAFATSLARDLISCASEEART